MATHHDQREPRRISEITDGEITVYGSSDGGTTWHPLKVDTNGQLNIISGLVPYAYDYVALSYTGSDLTGVVYKTGGVSGSTVATLTLAYTASVLDSITKT